MNTQVLWLLIKRISRKLNLGLLLSLLAFGSPAIASYVPPQTQKPPSDYTKSGGARGCPVEQILLIILSPTTYVGHTAFQHPTFVWFLDSPHNTEFRLFEFEPNGEPKQLGAPISLQAFSGITPDTTLGAESSVVTPNLVTAGATRFCEVGQKRCDR